MDIYVFTACMSNATLRSVLNVGRPCLPPVGICFSPCMEFRGGEVLPNHGPPQRHGLPHTARGLGPELCLHRCVPWSESADKPPACGPWPDLRLSPPCAPSLPPRGSGPAKQQPASHACLHSALGLFSANSAGDGPASLLLEFATEADSQLGQVGATLGVQVIRFTRAGPDLASPAELQAALNPARQYPGCHLHGSLPCTSTSSLQYAHIALLGPAFLKKLHFRRRALDRMVRNFTQMALLVSFEWPRFCHGGRRPAVRKLLAALPLLRCLMDGCACGLAVPSGELLLKPWTIYTTSPRMAKELQALRCTRDHQHAPVAGSNAAPLASCRDPDLLLPAGRAKTLCRAWLWIM